MKVTTAFDLIREILEFHQENLGDSFLDFLYNKRKESMIIEDILGLELTQDEKDCFEKMKNQRNDIAHGDNIEL